MHASIPEFPLGELYAYFGTVPAGRDPAIYRDMMTNSEQENVFWRLISIPASLAADLRNSAAIWLAWMWSE